MVIKSYFSALLFVVLFVGGAQLSFGRQGKHDAQVTDREILVLVNKHRTDMGLKPLTLNGFITKEAEQHSRNMATKSVPFSHDGFKDRSRRLRGKIANANETAENVAYGSPTAARVVDNWLHSEGHRKNIEGNYNLTGIGVARSSDGTLYYTQIFVKN